MHFGIFFADFNNKFLFFAGTLFKNALDLLGLQLDMVVFAIFALAQWRAGQPIFEALAVILATIIFGARAAAIVDLLARLGLDDLDLGLEGQRVDFFSEFADVGDHVLELGSVVTVGARARVVAEALLPEADAVESCAVSLLAATPALLLLRCPALGLLLDHLAFDLRRRQLAPLLLDLLRFISQPLR